jgi:hypothetical protein
MGLAPTLSPAALTKAKTCALVKRGRFVGVTAVIPAECRQLDIHVGRSAGLRIGTGETYGPTFAEGELVGRDWPAGTSPDVL